MSNCQKLVEKKWDPILYIIGITSNKMKEK